ncbi:hypothetical protein [Streptomyces tsukubensis]
MAETISWMTGSAQLVPQAVPAAGDGAAAWWCKINPQWCRMASSL